MTGDELAAALYTEQGYLVLACESPHKIGDIAGSTSDPPVKTQLRIVGAATWEEYAAQAKARTPIKSSVGRLDADTVSVLLPRGGRRLMKCLRTLFVAGPCGVCREFQGEGMHVFEDAIYCAKCCPGCAVVDASEMEGIFRC